MRSIMHRARLPPGSMSYIANTSNPSALEDLDP